MSFLPRRGTATNLVVLLLMAVILLGAAGMCLDGIDDVWEARNLCVCGLGLFLGGTYLVSGKVALKEKDLWPRDALSILGLVLLLVLFAFFIFSIWMLS